MALEAVVYPKAISSCNCKDIFSLGGWNSDLGLKQEEENGFQQNHVFPCFSSENDSAPPPPATTAITCTTTTTSRPKRRRTTKKGKNKEEVEIQRMTHIAVERNRRKQMNEYLAVLQSLMPASYVKRSDQASIIGGAINFVKELEQFLQSLEARKRVKRSCKAPPFADFFALPHYTSCSSQREPISENGSSIADIEVTMVESHANLKILSKRRPKQILKMVVGLQTLGLTVLHLNVTTVDAIGLYSFSVKVEDDCQLKSVDEIASAVHQMLHSIEEGAALN